MKNYNMPTAYRLSEKVKKDLKKIKELSSLIYDEIITEMIKDYEENTPKKHPQILHVFDQPGLEKGEVMVAIRYPNGKVEVDILIKDGQFPSEKACEISKALNNKLNN